MTDMAAWKLGITRDEVASMEIIPEPSLDTNDGTVAPRFATSWSIEAGGTKARPIG